MLKAVIRGVGILLLASAALVGCNQERNESIREMNEGLKLRKVRRPYEAVKHLEAAGRIDPTHDRAFFYLGMIQYRELNKLAVGEDNLRKAIKLNGQDHEYSYHLGILLSRKKDWAAAARAFEQAIEVHPGHAESHLRLGLALDRMERFDRAQEAYQQAIKLNPRRPEAYNALGGLYLRFEKYTEAGQVLRNAVENNPQAMENIRDLGLVYQAQKRYDDAIAQFKKALALSPGDPSSLFNLGMTCASNDQKDEAIHHLKHYMSRRTAGESTLRIDIARETLHRLSTAAK